MKKTAFILMLITIISKILGFFREIILSYAYGASNISDAYLISTTLPLVVFSFIGIGINTGYIPIFTEVQEKQGEKQANLFTSNLSNIFLVICLFVVVFSTILTRPIVSLFASGFEGETLNLAVLFTRITISGIIFTLLTYIFSGYLRVYGNFIIPALIGLPFNIIIILGILLSSKTNITILAFASLLGTVSQFIILLPFIKKLNYKHSFVFNLNNKYLKQMLIVAIPIIVGSSVNQLNVLVDRTLASSIAVGGISSLNYANRLNGFIQGLFVTTIATVMYPAISKSAAKKDFIKMQEIISESIISIILFVVPASVGAMVFSKEIVNLLFNRGAFDNNALIMTSSGLFFYSIGMLGFGLREIMSRAFYSLQDTRTPVINATIAVIINIILNLILSKYIGLGGLALATSISAIICTVLLFISFRKKVGPFGMKQVSIDFIKILISSLIMGIIAKLVYENLLSYVSGNLSLIISILCGAFVYFIIILFMRIKEVDSIIGAVRKKLKI